MYLQRKIEAHQRKDCCYGKAINIAFFSVYACSRTWVRAACVCLRVCARVALITQPAKSTRLICVLILRRIQRHIVVNVKTSLCKVPVILVGF
jgi:hypothetical protein